MRQPSKEWRETIAPDEEERFKKYAEQFISIQKVKSRQFGNGRGLHRKQLLAMKAKLDVLPGLPEYAAHGLFAKPASYDALVRLSNGGMAIQDDKIGDIRGFALKVLGVTGESALGGSAKSQDFLMINLEAFSSPKSDRFVEMVGALAKGPGALLKYLFSTYGFFGALGVMNRAKKSFNRPFHGFASENFHTAAPIACGPYACRVRLLSAGAKPSPDASKDWGADIRKRLSEGALVHELQLQFFVDESITPIEDASVNWPESEAPYITVARLTIPEQQFENEEAKKLAADVDKAAFDPWNALAAHRPLGDVMRTRKVVYFASQKTRGAS